MADGPPREAVILAAGLGSRFGGSDDLKPLAKLGVLGLVERNVRILAGGGLERVVLVTGHRHARVRTALLEAVGDVDADLVFVHNEDYTKKNGISAWRGGAATRGPHLLLMADHIFDAAILEHALATAAPERGGVLYVDRKVASVYDIDDATKVRTDEQGRVVAIGKQLGDYDAVDTGLFVVTHDLARELERVAFEAGDCSLSDGVQALADRGEMGTRDVGDGRWQDVDTMAALEHARALFGGDLSWP